MGNAAAARELLVYGIELEAAGAAQAGGGFTGMAEADRLIESSADAFLIGVLFTQGVPAERAWAGPHLLAQRLGTLDLRYLATHPVEVREAFQQRPMLHRFKETLPRWICSAAERLEREYAGDAANIWPAGDHVLDVTQRLAAFDGIGRKKAVMAVELLVRHFGVDLAGRECGSVAYDVHVRRVFLRAGIADEDTPHAMSAAAAEACPESPGTLDLATWLVGRDWCRPKAPRCYECRLTATCAKRVEITPAGVGVRPARS